MVTSITRWCHNTLITFATMQFVFRQQLQKLQKWWKDCDHCGLQEILMSVWQSILLDKWNPVVLDIGVSLLADLVLRPARPFHMNPQNWNVKGNPSLLERDAELGTSGSQCWRWRPYVHSKHQEPPPQQHGITSQKAWALNCHRNVKCYLQTSLLSEELMSFS